LSPILGQYNIKAADFLLEVKKQFITQNQNDFVFDEMFLDNVVYPLSLIFYKNNKYELVVRDFSVSFLYNYFYYLPSFRFFRRRNYFFFDFLLC
jgi:hypothetical protein